MLRIPQAEWNALRAHGEQTYPHECCGVLLGSMDGEIRSVLATLPCGNTRTDSPHDRYHISPQELIAAQKQARHGGMDIIGFYHSHPDRPTRWSATDLEEAHWLGCSYVITSVEAGISSRTNSFLLAGNGEEDKHFADEVISIE